MSSTNSGAPAPVDEAALFSKITWRLLPILVVSYGINYIDRINIGYAKLQMQDLLGWDEAIFGLGVGLFSVGYLLFEVPSNLMLEKIGVRKTLLRIMFLWGLASAGLMFVKTPTQFYVMRFLMGLFEAGFFPGIILYLTYWYPKARRGRMIAKFMVALPVSAIIAGPLSGAVLKYMDGIAGLHGWQWLMLVEGLPATALGFVAYMVLTDRPEHAKWLTPPEKTYLRQQLAADTAHTSGAHASHGLDAVLKVLKDPMILALAAAYFMTQGGNTVALLMMPTIIRSWGVPDLFMVGVYSAIPNIAAAIGMLIFGASSDRHNERRWHYLVAMLVSLLGIVIMLMNRGSLVTQLSGLSVMMFTLFCNASLMLALVTDLVPSEKAAAGIAAVTTLGGCGPVFVAWLNGILLDATGDPMSSFYSVFITFATAALIVMFVVPVVMGRRMPAAAATA